MNGTLARSFALAAAGALAGLLVSGCGGDDTVQSDPTPTPSFSSSSTAPTSSSAPVTPSTSAAAETPEAFVRRWNDLSTEMQNTGETAAYLAASMSCNACSKVAGSVAGYYADGGSVRTDGWKFASIDCKPTGQSSEECTAKVHNGPTQVKKSSGDDGETLQGGDFAALFYLDRAGGVWNMSNLEQQAQ